MFCTFIFAVLLLK